jgi:hypothetical protein
MTADVCARIEFQSIAPAMAGAPVFSGLEKAGEN